MTRHEFVSLAKEHSELHPGMLETVGRCMCYSGLQFASLWIAGNFFSDTYHANLSVFLILMILFELGRTITYKNKRGIWILFCLICMAGSAFLLLREASTVKIQCQQAGAKS